MSKLSFDTSYATLLDYMKQLQVNLNLFAVKGQKKAAFEARKLLQSMTKIQKTLRKDLQDAKKGMPTRKRVVRNPSAGPVGRPPKAAAKTVAPAGKVVKVTKKPVAVEETSED